MNESESIQAKEAASADSATPEQSGVETNGLADDGVETSTFHVSQEAYTGPLGKMLELVREHELDIFKVSLAAIADEYLAYVLSLQEVDLDEAGTYLVIAGQLLVMKSRQLLPTDTEEEEEEEFDERALLLRRLKDYEAFKEAADLLRKAEAERKQLYIREKSPPSVGEREAIEFYEVNVFDLATAFQRVMDEIGDDHAPVIQGEEYTIDEKMVELQLLLHETGELCLTLYLEGLNSRIEVIVTFLALLELMRLLKVRATQAAFFGDIWIHQAEELRRDEDGEMEVAVASEEVGYVGGASLDSFDDEDDDDEIEMRNAQEGQENTLMNEPSDDDVPETNS
jgi:segregation and condensation protein A